MESQSVDKGLVMVWSPVGTSSGSMGHFTFWISLSLSLFAQSEIRTERKLNQKVKSILFVRTQSEGLSEKTERKDWANPFGLKFGLSPNEFTCNR